MQVGLIYILAEFIWQFLKNLYNVFQIHLISIHFAQLKVLHSQVQNDSSKIMLYLWSPGAFKDFFFFNGSINYSTKSILILLLVCSLF